MDTVALVFLAVSCSLNVYATYKVIRMYGNDKRNQELIERLHEQVKRRDFIIKEEKELIEELEEAEGVR